MRDTLFKPSETSADWQRVSDYLDRAFDLEPPDREQWLSDLATTEPDVVDMLRRLLARHESLTEDGFLETSPPLLLGDLASARNAKEGERIGAYTLERPLGRGGMGEVWLASRSDGRFEGRCAIKFLDRLAGPGRFVERFRHEGRLLARLTHPNIARLIDAGSTDDGRQYLAIEYVDGEPIDKFCASQSLDIETRIRLFCDVVSAVATAHTSLIIHRDLKPTNVLVTREGTPKLLDFGIAKLLSPEPGEDDLGLTRFEEVALTPEYAAPEQLYGDDPSTATDVYQLGLLLYVLLTERHPFGGHPSRGERMKAALEGNVPPASELAPATSRAKLRGDLDAILSMALRKDPRERYATAAALREDLERYLNREPVNARRGAALYLLRKFVLRHRFAVVGSTVAIASLCAALVFAFTQARMAAGERDRAVALASRNQAVTEFVGTVISEAAESDRPITVKHMLARSEELALADPSGDRESRAAVLFMIADHYHAAGEHARSMTLLDRALETLGDSREEDLRAQIVCGKSILLQVMGRGDEAVKLITPHLDRLPTDTLAAAECLHARDQIALLQADAETGVRYATAAIERIRSMGHPQKYAEARYLASLAAASYRLGHLQESFGYYEQSLQILKELGRDRGPTGTTILNNYAVANDTAGVPKRALELMNQVVAIVTSRDADVGQPSPATQFNRARVLESIGRFTEARAAYESALQAGIEKQDKGAQVYSALGLADLSRQDGNIVAAQQYTDQMTKLLGPSEPPDSVMSLKLAIARGRLAFIGGKLDEAREQFGKALSVQKSRPTTIDAELAVVDLDLLVGNTFDAMASARHALDISTSLQGGLPYSRRTGLSWLAIGRSYQARGDRVEAHAAFESAVSHLSNTLDADHPSLVQARELSSATAATL